MISLVLSVAVGVGLLSCVSENAGRAGPWHDLFDGKSLEGWRPLGGKASFEVEQGAILGTSTANTPNTFLCTEESFHDFELEYEFKVDGALNSGVQIRSRWQDNRVRGYQIEIDMDPQRRRYWTGGLYEEGGRGWLADLASNEAARKAAVPDKWNRIRVVAIGPWIRTWVNDTPAVDHLDPQTLEGFIGLQVHGVGKRTDPLRVRWKNLRIRELGRHAWAMLPQVGEMKGEKVLIANAPARGAAVEFQATSGTVTLGQADSRVSLDLDRHRITLAGPAEGLLEFQDEELIKGALTRDGSNRLSLVQAPHRLAAHLNGKQIAVMHPGGAGATEGAVHVGYQGEAGKTLGLLRAGILRN